MDCSCFESGRDNLCAEHGQFAGENVQCEGVRVDRIANCCGCGRVQIVQVGALEIVAVICPFCCAEAAAKPHLSLVP